MEKVLNLDKIYHLFKHSKWQQQNFNRAEAEFTIRPKVLERVCKRVLGL